MHRKPGLETFPFLSTALPEFGFQKPYKVPLPGQGQWSLGVEKWPHQKYHRDRFCYRKNQSPKGFYWVSIGFCYENPRDLTKKNHPIKAFWPKYTRMDVSPFVMDAKIHRALVMSPHLGLQKLCQRKTRNCFIPKNNFKVLSEKLEMI